MTKEAINHIKEQDVWMIMTQKKRMAKMSQKQKRSELDVVIANTSVKFIMRQDKTEKAYWEKVTQEADRRLSSGAQ